MLRNLTTGLAKSFNLINITTQEGDFNVFR